MPATVGVVTGAGRGMGQACAQAMSENVDCLLLVDRDAEPLAAVASALSSQGHRADAMVLDVTDAAAVRSLAERIGTLGDLRAVVHAAGISPTMADWKRILTVDLVGTARVIDAVEPLIVAGTAMVCFASTASQLVLPTADPAGDTAIDSPLDDDLPDRLHAALGPAIEDSAQAYAWAKRGVQRLVQRHAIAWGPRQARICSVSPGMIETPMGRQEFEHQPAMATLLELTPLGRFGTADDVAAVVCFLLSDGAAFMTGTDVVVDGGVCAALSPR